MTVQLIHRVIGKEVHLPGDVVSFSESDESRLIKLGAAKYVDSQSSGSNNNDFDTLTEEQYKELFETLNKAANKDPLINVAIDVGVELTEEDKKKKETVIDRIIEQGFDDDVLDKLKEAE